MPGRSVDSGPVEYMPVVAIVISVLLAVISGFSKLVSSEVIGELKRKQVMLEGKLDGALERCAKLEERSSASSETNRELRAEMKRLSDRMVSREEWEQRHEVTDGLLREIREELRDRRSFNDPHEARPIGRRGLASSACRRSMFSREAARRGFCSSPSEVRSR